MKPVKSPPSPASKPSSNKTNPAQPGLLPVSDDLKMPHERDQDIDMTPDANSPAVQQAKKDVDRGLKDTSSAPEKNDAYEKLKR